jgi:hypothetical protein
MGIAPDFLLLCPAPGRRRKRLRAEVATFTLTTRAVLADGYAGDDSVVSKPLPAPASRTPPLLAALSSPNSSPHRYPSFTLGRHLPDRSERPRKGVGLIPATHKRPDRLHDKGYTETLFAPNECSVNVPLNFPSRPGRSRRTPDSPRNLQHQRYDGVTPILTSNSHACYATVQQRKTCPGSLLKKYVGQAFPPVEPLSPLAEDRLESRSHSLMDFFNELPGHLTSLRARGPSCSNARSANRQRIQPYNFYPYWERPPARKNNAHRMPRYVTASHGQAEQRVCPSTHLPRCVQRTAGASAGSTIHRDGKYGRRGSTQRPRSRSSINLRQKRSWISR